VNSDYSIQKLLEKELILISGRNEQMPGKPLVYATSKTFMDYFGINNTTDLPKIREVLAEQLIEGTIIRPEDFANLPIADSTAAESESELESELEQEQELELESAESETEELFTEEIAIEEIIIEGDVSAITVNEEGDLIIITEEETEEDPEARDSEEKKDDTEEENNPE
jgi:segregation and condensation protein B